MTVAKVDGDTVGCIWFNEMEGTFPSLDFIKDTLDVIDEDDFDEEEFDIDEEDAEDEADEEL